jgi:hypothetical protein
VIILSRFLKKMMFMATPEPAPPQQVIILSSTNETTIYYYRDLDVICADSSSVTITYTDPYPLDYLYIKPYKPDLTEKINFDHFRYLNPKRLHQNFNAHYKTRQLIKQPSHKDRLINKRKSYKKLWQNHSM